jgi:hypothetical protein
LNGLTLSGRARGLRLSRQKREFVESGCSLLESAAGPQPHIENVTRGKMLLLQISVSAEIYASSY